MILMPHMRLSDHRPYALQALCCILLILSHGVADWSHREGTLEEILGSTLRERDKGLVMQIIVFFDNK